MPPDLARDGPIDLPTLPAFGDVADTRLYAAIPDAWIVGVSDVVNSTEAIAAGRYRSVNMAGAAVISALSNAIGHGTFPFVFGGDGASFAVPPVHEAAARRALAETATMVAEEFGLTLRIGVLPASAIRTAGHDLRVARFAPSPNVAYAMFSGGGLAFAETQLKAGAIPLDPAPPGARPDLTGLSCRFDEMTSSRGTILSLIVRPGHAGETPAYREVIRDVLARAEASAASPVPPGGPPLAWPSSGQELDRSRGILRGLADFAARVGRSAFAYAVITLKIRIGRFDPRRYLAELVANSDYRKYDDGLRMTVDCSIALADDIERLLAEAAEKGLVVYGLHRQATALMTCFTPSVMRSDHIHFVDGASGGYAAAAAQLKERGG